MSVGRLLPNTRDTPEETKRRAFQEYGMLVIDVDKDHIPWEFREWLRQWGTKRYGPRRCKL